MLRADITCQADVPWNNSIPVPVGQDLFWWAPQEGITNTVPVLYKMAISIKANILPCVISGNAT